MMRVVLPLACVATGVAVQSKAGTGDGWNFIFEFVEQLRTECQTTFNTASESWAAESTSCSHEIAVKKSLIEVAQEKFQKFRNAQEREESKASSLANQASQLSAEKAKAENDKVSLEQQITASKASFDSLDAEYADNIAVIQKAIEFNMDKMDQASCVPKKTATVNDACSSKTTEATCVPDANSLCRWERPAALTKIQKMLNTLQDKFRTERVHAHDSYLTLTHDQQLTKMSLTQLITALDAQHSEASDLRSKAVTAAADAKNAARDAKVQKDLEQEALSDKEVACKIMKDTYTKAVDAHTKCKAEVSDMSQLVSSSMSQKGGVASCGGSDTMTADDCQGKEEQDCKDDGCTWNPAALLFLQLSTVNKHAENPMELLQRAAKSMGDETFIAMLQQPAAMGAPDPAAAANDPSRAGYPPNYNNWINTVICPSITRLAEARVGCDLSTSGCELATQAEFHCKGLECKSASQQQADIDACKTTRVASTCNANTANQCQVSDGQTCEEDLDNIREERSYLSGSIADLEDEAARLMNMIATKESDIEDKRDCISQANLAEAICQSDLDAQTAMYENDRATTKNLIANAQTMISTVNSNFAGQLGDPASTASQMMGKLTDEQTNLQFQYAAQQTAMDEATAAHAECIRSEKTKRRVCEKEKDTLEQAVSQLELDRVSTVKTLGNSKKVHAKTNSVENTMADACLAPGGKLLTCAAEFSQGVEDLQNAYNILKC